MAFLSAIKNRSDLRAQGVAPEQDERDPTSVVDTPWVTELDPQRFAELPSGGKWMQFYDHKDIYPHWRYAQYLYRNDKLKGVSNMKVSTSHEHHRFGSGVIIFYCGPPENEEKCLEIGKIILKETGYTHLNKNMLYKTDTQTLAKGAQGYKKWELKIPNENFENVKNMNEIKNDILKNWKGDGVNKKKVVNNNKKKGKKKRSKSKPKTQNNNDKNDINDKNEENKNNESETQITDDEKKNDKNDSNAAATTTTTVVAAPPLAPLAPPRAPLAPSAPAPAPAAASATAVDAKDEEKENSGNKNDNNNNNNDNNDANDKNEETEMKSEATKSDNKGNDDTGNDNNNKNEKSNENDNVAT